MRTSVSFILITLVSSLTAACGPQYEPKIPMALPGGQVMLVRKDIYCGELDRKIAFLRRRAPESPEIKERNIEYRTLHCDWLD